MKGSREVARACSRVLASRMDAQLMSRLLMVSTISSRRAVPRFGGTGTSVELAFRSNKEVRVLVRIQRQSPEPLLVAGLRACWMQALTHNQPMATAGGR